MSSSRAHLLHELPAIHNRHHEVEDDHVRTERPDGRERLLTVRRGDDLEALVLERGEQQLAYVRVIVDDQNAFPSHRAR